MIRITTTPAKIQIETSPARQEIQQPKADLQLETDHVRMDIETTLPKVKIDQSQSFSEAGLKGVRALLDDMISNAQSAHSKGMSRVVSQGDEMIDIHTGVDAVASQAEQNGFETFNTDITVKSVPQTRPQITVEEGENDIQYNKGESRQTVNVNPPVINYTPGQVKTSMAQYNSISFEYVGENMDMKI
jgi:hypothetical protein